MHNKSFRCIWVQLTERLRSLGASPGPGTSTWPPLASPPRVRAIVAAFIFLPRCRKRSAQPHRHGCCGFAALFGCSWREAFRETSNHAALSRAGVERREFLRRIGRCRQAMNHPGAPHRQRYAGAPQLFWETFIRLSSPFLGTWLKALLPIRGKMQLCEPSAASKRVHRAAFDPGLFAAWAPRYERLRLYVRSRCKQAHQAGQEPTKPAVPHW
jgi:hypothetical protein